MNDKRSLIISIVFILLILVLGSYSVYIHLSKKGNDNIVQDKINETKENKEENDTNTPKYPQDNIDDIQSELEENSTNIKTEQEIEYELDPELAYPDFEIPDEEIKTLYSYVESSVFNYNSVCFMNYYHHPFDRSNEKELFSAILNIYAQKYEKPITNSILNKFPESERLYIKSNSNNYVTGDIVRKGLKEVFNVDDSLINFENYESFPACYNYYKEVDAFLDGGCGGDYEAFQYQKIINYEKSESLVEMTVVQAEIDFLFSATDDNGQKQYISNVYRKHADENTLIYKNINEDKFEFTKNNVRLFPQIKYIFKKNQNGKFYVYDIVNLNYQDEYFNCN